MAVLISHRKFYKVSLVMEKSFGIQQQTSIAKEEDRHLEEITIHGFTVIEDVLDENELRLAVKKLDEVYQLQLKEFSEQQLESIQEAFLVRLPLAYDDYFIELVKKEKIVLLLRKILGNYFILNLQNGIINMPKQTHYQNSWHRDLPYQDFVISKPLSISVLYCLDDFNPSTGGTFLIPFSHKLDRMPSDPYIEKHSFQVTAKKGSAILFDSMMFHRAGYNTSDQIRRGVNHMFTVPILKQQINIPESLNGKFSDDPFLKRLLGYEDVIPKTAREWRNKRLKKQKFL